jgi:hypothetical protein
LASRDIQSLEQTGLSESLLMDWVVNKNWASVEFEFPTIRNIKESLAIYYSGGIHLSFNIFK